jgi:predicted  nucleic acid-binding Zn-ribbon protein
MPLTKVDAIKINQYLNQHAIGDIYYQDMVEVLGKKTKVTDTEFLEFFTETIMTEFKKDTKLQSKRISKILSVIEAFLGWLHEDDKPIEAIIIDKIRSFDELYEEYLIRTEQERDLELIDKYIKNLIAVCNELYPTEANTESVARYVAQITELELTISRLKKEIESLNKLNENANKTITQKSERIQTLSQDLVNINNEVSANVKEINRLTKEVAELDKRAEELEDELVKAKLEVINLTPLKQQCEALAEQVSSLGAIITATEKEKKKQERLVAKESKIEEIIYKKLLVDGLSVSDLVGYLKSKNISTNMEQVHECLRRFKQHINVECSSFKINPKYKITAPTLEKDSVFRIDVPYGCKYYDIMLVSDFHLEDFDHKVITGFDALNDYCAGNGINLILNLGDFYHGFSAKNFVFDNAVRNYKLAEESIAKIPRHQGIYHAILGGNHDRNVSNYGFDPIKVLTEGREDFIHLGYNHSSIILDSPTGALGQFDIHHPDTFDFPIDLTEDGINPQDIEDYLNMVYERCGQSREDSYFDILGHTHKSQFNCMSSYCYIPSFLEGRGKRGACHVRIYLDEETGFKYMVFMPLSYNPTNKLVKNNEIIYQKPLSR